MSAPALFPTPVPLDILYVRKDKGASLNDVAFAVRRSPSHVWRVERGYVKDPDLVKHIRAYLKHRARRDSAP